MDKLFVSRFQQSLPVFLLTVLFFLVLNNNSLADNPGDSLEQKPLRKGSNALQFQIAPNFQLSSFQGAIFSGKHHYSERSALRIGVDLSLRFTDSSIDRNYSVNDTLGTSESNKGDDNTQSIGITTQYIYYTRPNTKVNFFLGTGPYFNYSRIREENTFHRNDPLQETDSQETIKGSGWSAGLSNVMGIEWFIAKKISLTAENRFLIGYSRTETERIRESNPGVSTSTQEQLKSTGTSFFFSPANIILGVTGYF